MQPEAFDIVLCGVQVSKDVMIQSLYQGDTFDWSEKIFCYDIAELVVRNILNIIGCNVRNLSESVIPGKRQFAAIKDSFLLQIYLSVHFAGFAVLIGYFSFTVCLLRLDRKPEAFFFGESLQNLFPDVLCIGEIPGNVIGNDFRNHFFSNIERAVVS